MKNELLQSQEQGIDAAFRILVMAAICLVLAGLIAFRIIRRRLSGSDKRKDNK
jgi:hypothetical protein